MANFRRFLTGFFESEDLPALGPGELFGKEDGSVWLVKQNGSQTQLGTSSPGGTGAVEVSKATVSYQDIIFGPAPGPTTTLALETLDLGDVLIGVGLVVIEEFDDSGGGNVTVMDGTQQIALTGSYDYAIAQEIVAGFQQLNHNASTFGKAYVMDGDGINMLIVAAPWEGDGTKGSLDVYFWIVRAANITT